MIPGALSCGVACLAVVVHVAPREPHCGLFVGVGVTTKKPERWEGGRIHRQADGRPLYIIERQVSGRRYHISTRTHTARAAYEHLRRFESDPAAYALAMAEETSRAAELTLTADLVMEFRTWMLTRRRPVTRKHANQVANLLADWTEDLGGRDLRRLDLAHLKACLDRRRTMRGYRIAAIKALCSWLRLERHVLSRAEDATQDLLSIQAIPEKHRRRKAVSVERVRAVLPHLPERVQDVLILASATGWHTTELARFARGLEAEILPGPAGSEIVAVLMVRHKGGELSRTPLKSQSAADAAVRIRARGTWPKQINELLRQAAEKATQKAQVAGGAKVEPFTLGVMRHSVATWAVERGALPEQVAEFLGHKDSRTTKRFYVDVAAPTFAVDLPTIH